MKAKPIFNLHKKLYNAYQKGGASAVIEIANKLNLPFSHCTQCESDTPTIKHVTNVCGVCGTVKREKPSHHKILSAKLVELNNEVVKTIESLFAEKNTDSFIFEAKDELFIPETDFNEKLTEVKLENETLVFVCQNVNDDEFYDYQYDQFSTSFLIEIVGAIEKSF
jgi:hypothetical protein